jgi:Zn-dependent protease
MNNLADLIAGWAIRVPVILFAITIHEYAHGRVALAFGDPTAKNAGRLTMNPISHLDPLGTICMLFSFFGWAKPVPVDVRYFKNIRKDTILMSIAGPMANFATAFVAGILIRYIKFPGEVYELILVYVILMNTGLGIFNLLPIPPLDGSHVLENILPPSMGQKFHQTRSYAPVILIILLIMDHVMHLNILSRLSDPILKVCALFGGDPFKQLVGMN